MRKFVWHYVAMPLIGAIIAILVGALTRTLQPIQEEIVCHFNGCQEVWDTTRVPQREGQPIWNGHWDVPNEKDLKEHEGFFAFDNPASGNPGQPTLLRVTIPEEKFNEKYDIAAETHRATDNPPVNATCTYNGVIYKSFFSLKKRAKGVYACTPDYGKWDWEAVIRKVPIYSEGPESKASK